MRIHTLHPSVGEFMDQNSDNSAQTVKSLDDYIVGGDVSGQSWKPWKDRLPGNARTML